MKMSVKFNVLVICVVILHSGECNDCDDALKCVTTWVAAALPPNSNVTKEIIEDVAANVTQSNKSSIGNLVTDFLADTFSYLIKENPAVNVLEHKTNIYVQTFKINDSIFGNESFIKSTTEKSNIIDRKKENEYKRDDIQTNTDTFSAIMTVQPMTKVADDKTTKNYDNDDNSHNVTSNILPEYSTNDINYMAEQEKTTTSVYLNIEVIRKSNDFLSLTTEKTLINDATTMDMEMTRNNNSDVDFLSKHNNISEHEMFVNVNKENNLEIKINDNYIDDVYDFHGNNEIDVSELLADNLTDYLDIDYTDFYKDTTNEDAEYTPPIYIPTTTEAAKIIIDKKPTDGIDSVYPWIATMFVTDGENKQFEYICDGSLVSERLVLSAARCVMKANVTVDVANILIILGKRSLQAMGQNEIVLRVKSIKVHDNFVPTEGKVDNDLAVVVLAEPVLFNDDIRPAPLGVEDKSAPLATATTGWHVSGPLQPLYLEPQSSCMAKANSENYLCATLGDSEITCPSYGGLLIDRQDDNIWRLKGIASGSPTSKGVCFNKHLMFTKLENYLDWIMKNVKEASDK